MNKIVCLTLFRTCAVIKYISRWWVYYT